MDAREISAAIANGFAEMNKRVDGELAKIRDELKTPVTRNAAGIAYGDAAHGAPAVESADTLKGKGLKFARVCRMLARASQQNIDPMSMVEEWGLEKHLVARLLDRDGMTAKVYDAGLTPEGTKALGESTVGAGGALVPDQYSQEFIELLRARVVLVNAGVTRIPMSTKTVTLGRQNGAATFTWVGESQAVNASQQTFDDVQLNLRKGMALTPISNDLLRDNAIASDIIVRNDLLKVAALAWDLAAIRGLGTAYQPRGLFSIIGSANQFESAAAGTYDLTSQIADLNKAVRLVKEANVPFNAQTGIWLMSPRTEDGYRRSRDGVGRPFWAEEMDEGTLNGYRYFTTTQIPNNLSGGGSGGSTESELYFVVLDECLIGEGLQPTIEVARNAAYVDATGTLQSGLSRDETAVSVVLRVDFNMRHNLAAARVKGVVDGS